LTSASRAADVVIGVPNWPSVNVTAHILQVIIETNFALQVELQTASNPVIFEAISKGSIHIHPEVWLPNQQGLVDRYAAFLIKGQHPASAVQGLYVNGAGWRAGIRDISDLTDPAKARLLAPDPAMPGEIYIGAAGWSVTEIEKLRAAQYGYDQIVHLSQLDEGLAQSQLSIAARRGRPWVGYCYLPHHIFILHPDLRPLHEPPFDPAKWQLVNPQDSPAWQRLSHVAMAWPAQSIQPVYSSQLARLQPQVASLVSNIDLATGELSEFAYEIIVNKADAGQYAAQWVHSHSRRVAGWLR
jgi:glycine betaine/proline transport system substrate-binding protein